MTGARRSWTIACSSKEASGFSLRKTLTRYWTPQTVPQRLKPRFNWALCGSAEAEPFQGRFGVQVSPFQAGRISAEAAFSNLQELKLQGLIAIRCGGNLGSGIRVERPYRVHLVPLSQ
jgi:hypothetical protein